ncbi:uncharacterized protein TNCV_3768171 [Trichonephila clavipes]|nr:uncharacterized protein TNCV_3768171 [Trichonephila clavipes]
MRIQLRNKLNENKLKAGNRINDLANVCILSGKRTAEVREPVNKGRLLNNPVVNKSVENAKSCDFEKKNCDPPVRCTNVSHPSEVGRKEFNVNRSSDCDVEMKVGVCEGRVKTVAMGAQQVINLDNIGDGSFELKEANPEGLICENSCEEKYTLGTLVGCEKQLTVDRESFRNHTIAKIAGKGGGKNTCKADVRKCLKDGSNIGSEFTFEIDLPGKRDRSTIYRLNLIKLYHRKPELENLVMKNSSEGIDSETLYSGFVNGILETGGVMDKCVQMWTRNYGALGQTAIVCFGVLCANSKKEEVKRDFGDLRIRRSEGRVVNTPLVFKKGTFEETKRPEKKERTRKRREKELGKEKG